MAVFDRIANSYDSSLAPLPREYVQLIQTRFALAEKDAIIDLGCGSGLLTFALSRFSSDVQGIDSSEEMIKIARSRDAQKRIRWICSPVEEFDLGCNRYKLIISFEAFHLLPEPRNLIRRCALALRKGGYLCVGWISFQWELLLKSIIVDVFASYGIAWGQRANLAEVDLTSLVQGNKIGLSSVVKETVNVETDSHISQVATYLASIEKAASLENNTRRCLARDLEDRFRQALSSEWISGVSSYSLAYCRKCAASAPD